MKTLDYIHLDAVAAGKVVEALQQLLADYQVFYTNLRGFHWNIKGHGFFVLHSKFEDMYNDAAEKVDELAERILMLGGVPVNKGSIGRILCRRSVGKRSEHLRAVYCRRT